jgi:hypothetical protein
MQLSCCFTLYKNKAFPKINVADVTYIISEPYNKWRYYVSPSSQDHASQYEIAAVIYLSGF